MGTQGCLQMVPDNSEKEKAAEVVEEHDEIQERLLKLITRVRSAKREVRELKVACQLPAKKWERAHVQFRKDMNRINLRNEALEQGYEFTVACQMAKDDKKPKLRTGRKPYFTPTPSKVAATPSKYVQTPSKLQKIAPRSSSRNQL